MAPNSKGLMNNHSHNLTPANSLDLLYFRNITQGITILRGRLTQPLRKEETPYNHNVDLSQFSNQRRTRRDAHDLSHGVSWFHGISSGETNLKTT